MHLGRLQIQHFRNFEEVSVTPSSSLNVLIGQNGSGKSSFLESIFYLGFARSFRTTKHKSVIQTDSPGFSIFTEAVYSNNQSVRIGLTRNRSDEFLCSIDGVKSKRMSDLIAHLPVLLFTPQSSDILIGGPQLRRRFLDWGLFHVEQSFHKMNINYMQLLKQRNACLRSKDKNTHHFLPYWTSELAAAGDKIHQQRVAYVEALNSQFQLTITQFLPEISFQIQYNQGWDKNLNLVDALNSKIEIDNNFGYTSVGIHKADLKITADGMIAVERLSRGQLRMLVAALQIAQAQHLSQQTRKSTIFLLDDIGAELDLHKRELFIDELMKAQAQCFVSAIEYEQVAFINKYQNKKMFHVEQNQVKEEQ